MNDTPGAKADGSIDYSDYTAEKLFWVLQRIDAERYPLNFANLKAELAARQIPVGESATAEDALMAAQRVVYLRPQALAPEIRIAFAPRHGFLTWLGPSRNDFRLVGSGSISVHGTSVVVKGRRFGFILGLPLRRSIDLHAVDIFNVEREENVVRLERRLADGKVSALTFWLADVLEAEKLAQVLPAEKTTDFVPQLAAHVEFERQLDTRAPNLPVTYVFAALCLLMFAVTISHGAEWFKATGVVEIVWGSNFGPSTIGGQWWRLLTYSLLHFGIIHLAFNMWALVSFGAIAERLYGSFRYAIIFLVAGVAGGMTSIVVQPNINSAGASAVLFGIFGALLVAHLRGAEAIPPSVQRSLRNSTLFYAAVALIGGFLFAGIDNAAHVGGLVAGTGVGLAFHSPRRAVRIMAPAMLAVLVIFTGATLGQRAAAIPTDEATYWESFRWFVGRESGAVAKWVELQSLARDERIGDVALADRLDKELVPFWREMSERLEPLKFDAGTEIFAAHRYMKAVSNGRLHALELCVSGLRVHDVKVVGECMEEMGRVDGLINERLKVVHGEN